MGIAKTIDNVISVFSPQKALQRTVSREAFKTRSYDADKRDGTRVFRAISSDDGNVSVQKSGKNIRELARELDDNNDIASGALTTMVGKIVGNGIRPEPQIKTKDGKELAVDINKKILELYYDWAKNPEVTGRYNWGRCQRMACRSWLRDGEAMAQLLGGKNATLEHNSRVQFSIELIESDLFPLDYNDQAKNIVSSIEMNSWNRPVKYHLYSGHPNGVFGDFQILPTKEINAENLVHLFYSKRITQMRGISIFANVFRRLDDLRDYDDSERIAARIAASMTMWRRRGETETQANLEANDPETWGKMSIKQGMMLDIANDADIGMFDSNRPNTNLEAFSDGQLRKMAGGLGCSYSELSKNYNGTYSSQRQEMMEQKAVYDMYRDDFVSAFYEPIWKEFVKYALIALPEIDKANVDKNTLFDAVFRAAAMPWIDPLKEVKADQIAVQSGFKSRSQVNAEKGRNPEEVINEIEREQKLENEKGIILASNYANEVQQVVVNDNNEEEEVTKDD